MTGIIYLHIMWSPSSLKMSIESHNLLKYICFLKMASKFPVKFSYWPCNVIETLATTFVALLCRFLAIYDTWTPLLFASNSNYPYYKVFWLMPWYCKNFKVWNVSMLKNWGPIWRQNLPNALRRTFKHILLLFVDNLVLTSNNDKDLT